MAPKSGHSDPPSWMEPQLATLTHEPFSDPDWVFDRKLDGVSESRSLGVVQPSQRLQDDFPVCYYLFDVLYADGEFTRELPA